MAPTPGRKPTRCLAFNRYKRFERYYHCLTHQLGELIVESLGEDPAEFRKYFDFDDPDLAASLNHNYSLDVFAEDERANVQSWYDKFDSKTWCAHRGPPFVALLINDRPGLQVVAGEGQWMNAPVTCRTAPGDYVVPVIPGSVIVNTGGTLMHLSEGRYSATLHRLTHADSARRDANIHAVFSNPKNGRGLNSFRQNRSGAEGAAGYNAGRDGVLMRVLIVWVLSPGYRRWWVEEFKELSEKQRAEVEAETDAAYKMAAERGSATGKARLSSSRKVNDAARTILATY